MIKSWKHLLAKFKLKMLVLMTSILKVRIAIYTVTNSCLQCKNELCFFNYSDTGEVTNLVLNSGLSIFFLALFLSTKQLNEVHDFEC